VIGPCGVEFYRRNPTVVDAVVENGNGGVFRSEDRGETWTKMSDTDPRVSYYSQIRIDPNNEQRIWVLGANMYISDDGGRTFKEGGPNYRQIHGDFHAMWIDPTDPNHVIIGCDGGVYISRDRTRTVDFVPNLPVSQYYAIAADMREPYYYVYGGLQDNNSWAGPSQTRNRQGITNSDWFATTGGDGFYAQIDPTDPNTVYGESQGGDIVRYDVRTGEQKTIKPVEKFGSKPYRWNWSSPMIISPFDHNTIYFGANYLFKSTSRGDAWTVLGPDLTRQISRDSLPVMGKIWPKDAISRHQGTAEYGNISTIDESPLRQGLLYVGTDDGLISVSRDDGETWARIAAFPGVPAQTYVSRVVASRAAEGTVYATFDNHRNNDFKPYVLKSTDYGAHWTSITGNLPASGSVQVIREHPRNASLLFAGTEFGAFYSPNGGASWTQLKYNIPTVAVHDILIHPRENDLVIATHGRGIYILDDITPLERFAEAQSSPVTLFPTKPVTEYNPNRSVPGGVRGAGALGDRQFAAPNPAYGAMITYFVRDTMSKGGDVSLSIFDSTGRKARDLTASKNRGMHRVTWDLRGPAPYTVRPTPAVGGPQGRVREIPGAFVLPGHYIARLTLKGPGGFTKETSVEVRADPLVQLSSAQYADLYNLRVRIGRLQATVQAAVRTAESLNDEITDARAALRNSNGSDSLSRQVDAVSREVTDILRKIRGGAADAGADDRNVIQPSVQERVNNIADQIGDVTSPPTQNQRATVDQAEGDLQREVARLNTLLQRRIPALNAALDAAGVPWTIGRAIEIK